MTTKTTGKPSLGTAINELFGTADASAIALDDNGAEDQAKALRDAIKTARAALKAAQPKPDPKEQARRREAQDDADLDEMLSR